MGPPTREIVGIGAPPPSGPGHMGPPPRPKSSGSGVYMVMGLLLLALVGGVALVVATGDDDKDGGEGAAAAGSNGGSTSVELGGNGGGGGSPTPTTAPTTPTTLPPTPAEAAVNDCIQVGTSGGFLGTGSCSDGATPYMVTEVVPQPGSCSNADAAYISSGDFVLCLQVNLVETYCYVFPEAGSLEFITPALACETPGTVHVIDIVPGATDGNSCTSDYQWNLWYPFTYPQMVACVMEY